MISDPSRLDPISLEIFQNALRSAVDEAYIALMKSAYSTNIKERHDHTVVLIDRLGRIILQSEKSLPGHLGSVLDFMPAVHARYPEEEIHEGDIFIANDPYSGGATHLPDINIAKPIFLEGRLVAMVCTIAHHADMGGAAAGSMSSRLTNIYQEGLRLPVCKLVRRGEMDRDILDIILLNVRVPDERRGDYFAQVAACNLAERRLAEIGERYSAAVFDAAFDELIARTRTRIDAAIRIIPPGAYGFEDLMDSDGHGAENIRLKLTVTIAEGEKPVFDFTGSDSQVTGNINCTYSATRATVAYALKALLDPNIPNNEGIFNSFEMIAENGSVLASQFPAAVANRAQTSQRVADMVIGAFAEALPERATAASHGTTILAGFSGAYGPADPGYVYFEVIAGGGGGRATKPGKDGTQVHVTNTSNLPVEAIEMEYPLFVESYSLIASSGGEGRNRGGRGIRRVVRPLQEPCYFEGHGERFHNRPWGVFGGGAGQPGHFYLASDDGTIEELPAKPAGVKVRKDQVVIIEAPGGGGYGEV